MVTVVQKPQKYTPSNNPIIFQVESSFSNILNFKLEVLEAETNAVISVHSIDVPPDYVGSFIDLSAILTSYVKWEINNAIGILSIPVQKTILAYKIRITERGLVNGAVTNLDSPYTIPDTFYVWEAELNGISFNSFSVSNYVLANGLPVRFLTQKPNFSKVNDHSSEQLFFLHDEQEDLELMVKTYNSSNTLLNTYFKTITGLSESPLIRLQVSPKALIDNMLVSFDGVHKYEVFINKVVGEEKIRRTEIRTYKYASIPCQQEPINLIWENGMGGFDSYQFLNPQSTLQVQRISYQRPTYRIDSGIYSNRTGEVLNSDEEIITVNKESNYQVYTDFLTDAEGEWLKTLFQSKKVYVELFDETLVPVSITNTSYKVEKDKYNRSGFNFTEVNFKMNGDPIPVELLNVEGGFGTGQAQVDFIDEQMNNNPAFDTILEFESATLDGAEGVGAAVAAINSTILFEFNKINPRLGLTNNMTIKRSAIEVMSVDFLGDYLGKPFRFTDADGNEHYGTFINGIVNF